LLLQRALTKYLAGKKTRKMKILSVLILAQLLTGGGSFAWRSDGIPSFIPYRSKGPKKYVPAKVAAQHRQLEFGTF
jgi:hypothetical protein